MGNLDAAHCCFYFGTIRARQKWLTLMLLIVVAFWYYQSPSKMGNLDAACRCCCFDTRYVYCLLCYTSAVHIIDLKSDVSVCLYLFQFFQYLFDYLRRFKLITDRWWLMGDSGKMVVGDGRWQEKGVGDGRWSKIWLGDGRWYPLCSPSDKRQRM